jgi:two-component system, LuxR family, response regulator FixJ
MAESSDVGRMAYIIDDDRDLRISLYVLLRTMGVDSRPFACAQDFAEEYAHLQPGCIILDIAMPGKDGLTLLADMRGLGCDWPVAIMTGHGEVKSAVRAMKLGAIEFLEKPFRDTELAEALDRGFEFLDHKRVSGLAEERAKAAFKTMSSRERDVLELITEGLPNKLIAHRLAISVRTVEMHRARLIKRVGVANTAELVRYASLAGLLGTA